MRDEQTFEKALDIRVQRRLATDAAYRNAENANEQAEREREIEEEEERALTREILRIEAERRRNSR